MTALTAACAAGDERSVLHLLHGATRGGGGVAGIGSGRRSPARAGVGASPPPLTAPFIDAIDEDGMSGMMRAAVCGHHKIVRLLHDNGASASAARRDGMTTLMLATRPGHENVVFELLKLLDAEEINVQRPRDGASALILACRNGEEGIALMLMQRGSLALEQTTNADNDEGSGETALLAACRVGAAAIALHLLSFGAAYDARNEAGESALNLALAALGSTQDDGAADGAPTT